MIIDKLSNIGTYAPLLLRLTGEIVESVRLILLHITGLSYQACSFPGVIPFPEGEIKIFWTGAAMGL